MKDYNGFPNYNQWNQNLWIANDEGLYLTAKACIETADHGCLKNAAQVFIDFMKDQGQERTPDNVKWSFVGVYRAFRNNFAED